MAQTRKPVKLTPEVQSRIIQQIRLGAAWEQAAVAAGVSRTTLLRWRKSAESGESPRFRRFFLALDKALAESEAHALRRIHEANNPEGPSAAGQLPAPSLASARASPATRRAGEEQPT